MKKKILITALSSLLLLLLGFMTFMYNTQETQAQDLTYEDGHAQLIQEGEYPETTNVETRSYNSSTSWDNAVAAIVSGLKDCNESINVSSYYISKNDVSELYAEAINENPDLFYVTGTFSFSYDNRNVVYEVCPVYLDTTDVISTLKSNFDLCVTNILNNIDDSLSDVEIALQVHDYICTHAQYNTTGYYNNTLTNYDHSAYGIIVNQTGVCDAYALSYQYILNQLGVDAYVVTSDSMAHAWNIVSIDGSYYHADLTWDDPVSSSFSSAYYVCHDYFLCSDTAIRADQHYDWTDLGISCSNTKYDSSPLKDATCGVSEYGGYWYYIDEENGYLYKLDLSTDTSSAIKRIGYNLSSTIYGDKLYYCAFYGSTGTTINSCDLDGNNQSVAYTTSTTSTGVGLENGYLYYCADLDTKYPLVSDQIEDGIYTIYSTLNSSYCFDLSSGSAANGTNMQIWTSNGSNAQQFKITYVGNNLYTITSMISGKSLDVSGSGTTNGTNLQEWQSNGTSAQLWYINKNKNGSYTFSSACNNLVIDVSSSQIYNGNNLQLWTSNNTAAQQFTLVATTYTQSIADGTYVMQSALNNSYAMDISSSSTSNGANLQLWGMNYSDAQQYIINYIGDGLYKITVKCSNKVLDVSSSGQSSGTNVQQWESNSTSAQQWYIQDNGDNTYSIYSSCNGLSLDVSGSNTTNGNNIQVWEPNSSTAQKFVLTSTDTDVITEGEYEIRSALNTNFTLDISGSSMVDGGNLQLWTANSTNAQRFNIKKVSTGVYEIVNVNSSKYLDVNASGTANGTNVQQWTGNSTNAQRWYVIRNSNSTYTFISVCNGLALDVNHSGTYNGNNIQVWESNAQSSQQFILK